MSPFTSLSSQSFRTGVRRAAPLVPGLIPFGLVAGVASVEPGLTVVHAVGMAVSRVVPADGEAEAA